VESGAHHSAQVQICDTDGQQAMPAGTSVCTSRTSWQPSYRQILPFPLVYLIWIEYLSCGSFYCDPVSLSLV
jgi:hypothetical protein